MESIFDSRAWRQQLSVSVYRYHATQRKYQDIGGGTTEIAVIALGGIVCDKSVKKIAGVFNKMIVYICTQHNLGWRKYRGENKNQIAAIED
jgi:actin-like ATPase involved in cell morphogenesis